MRWIGISLSIVFLIVFFSNCDEPERTELTRAEKALVDSLYGKKVPYMRKYADTISDATYQGMFDRAADSIKLIYIQEIKEIVEGEG